MTLRSSLVLAASLLPLSACFPTKISKAWTDTGARLLMLAGEEAALVPSHTERLTRLLNVAHRQIQRGRGDDARVALRQAKSALQESAKIDEHARMAAWVSLSELSRRAKDEASARDSAAEAVKFLKSLQPVARRTEYVRGLALELRLLEGEQAAIPLLREAAGWALELAEPAKRRNALTAIAWDLFLCEDFDGGRDALRKDQDAAWRSDMLTTLAALGGSYQVNQSSLQGLAYGRVRTRAKSYHFQGASSTSPAPAAVRWGKSVNFESVYLKR